MCGVYTPPKVISMSYGESEEDIPIKYAKRQCNEFMKLGLQGHSIFVSSGDYGVAQPPGDPPGSNGCLSNLDAGLNGTIFNPAYPSDCPFLTSVGATMLPVNATVYDDEVVMNIPAFLPLHFSSGGGFSNYYPVPEYQRAAVDEYFANHDPEYKYYEADFTSKKVIGANGGIYARNGRAFPDVAANGAYHPIFLAGEAYHEFGTSLSAPTFASVITLVSFLLHIRHMVTSFLSFESSKLTGILDQRRACPSGQGPSRLCEPGSLLQCLGFERHHKGQQFELWNRWFQCRGGLGPGHRARHAEVPGAVESVHGNALRLEVFMSCGLSAFFTTNTCVLTLRSSRIGRPV